MERDIKRSLGSVDSGPAGRRAGERFSQSFSQAAGSGMQGKMAAVGAVGAKALGGALTVGVAAAGAAITGTLGAALSKGFDRLKSIDEAKFKLKALGNSASDVQGIMDSALESVKGTAFGMGDAATIAASAVAAGVKPGKELTEYLSMTADAAAVAGTSLSDMGRIINQVRTGQVAYTEDIQQLAERGIPIYQWLGDSMKVPAAEVKKLASEGKISSEIFEKAIRDHIGGAAKEMGQSFSGSVQNAQAALGRLGEALLKPAFQQAPGGISAITSALDGLTAWVNSNQGLIIGFWEGVGQATISTAQATLQAVGSMTEAMGQLVGGVGNVEGAMLKVQSAAARFRGDGEEADRLNAEAEAAFGWGESLQDAGRKMRDTAASMDQGKESLRAWGEEARKAADNPVLAKLGTDVVQQAANVKAAFDKLPKDVPVNVSAPGGQETFDLLKKLGVQVTTNNDKEITVDAPMAPEVLKMLEDLGIKVTTNNDKTITVTQEGAEEASSQIDQAARDREATIRVLVDTAAAGVDAGAALGAGVNPSDIPRRADGGIVPMANGGLRFIDKPEQADIYEGRGAGTVFAEEETGGEAYIPLAPAKRERSTAILAEVARLFGLNLSAPTGAAGGSVPAGGDLVTSLSTAVTAPIVSALEQIRDALSSGSVRYSASSPLPVSFTADTTSKDGENKQISLLHSMAQQVFGLDEGFTGKNSHMVDNGFHPSGQAGDFNGTVEEMSKFARYMTDNFAPYIRELIFQGPGVGFNVYDGKLVPAIDMPGSPYNTKQAGYHGDHVHIAVLNEKAAQFAAALQGADSGGAWESLASSSRQLDTALQDRADVESQLADTVTTQVEQKAQNAQGGGDASSLGQSLVSGLLQGIGLDGSVFSNPFEWANTKSLTALANWGGGLLQGLSNMGKDAPATEVGGGTLGIPGVPNVADFLKPLPAGSMIPDAPHQGGGQPPGPTGPAVVVNGNLGVDPRQFTQRIDAAQNQAYRRNLNAVRP